MLFNSKFLFTLFIFFYISQNCYANSNENLPYFYNNKRHIPPLSRSDVLDMYKYFPPQKYNSFPKQVRLIVQRAESEADTCHGSVGENGKWYKIVMRSCEISDKLFDLLEDRGWCWGGGASAAEDQWMLCSKLSALHRNYRTPKHP